MKKKIVLLSQLFGLLSILWLCYFLLSVFFNHHIKNNHFFPPKSAQLSICINGEDLVNKIAFTAFIDSKDSEIAQLIREKISARNSKSDSKQKLLGIDLFSTIHFFTDEVNGEQVSGFIFNLDDPTLWDKNSAVFFGAHSYSHREENSGLVLTSLTLSKKQLATYFNNSEFNIVNDDSHESVYSMQLRYVCSNSIEKTIHNISSNVGVNRKSITADGNIILGKNVEVSQLSFSLFPQNFHIDSRIIPIVWNDTLMAWAKRYVTEIPPIKAVSLNYGGLEIQSTNNGVLPLPNMELILEFNKDFSIQNFINSTETRGDIDIQLKSTYFKIGPKIYYLQQLSPTTIYIGTTKNPVIQTKKISSVISIEGSPHYLTDVKGSRFMMTLINMNDQFSQLKELFGNIKTINGSLRLKGNQPLQYKSRIEFKSNQNALDELLKLLLSNT